MARYRIPNQMAKNPYFTQKGKRGFIPVPKKSVSTKGQWFQLRREGQSLSLLLLVEDTEGKVGIISTMMVNERV